jgi:hypothetical protein
MHYAVEKGHNSIAVIFEGPNCRTAAGKVNEKFSKKDYETNITLSTKTVTAGKQTTSIAIATVTISWE